MFIATYTEHPEWDFDRRMMTLRSCNLLSKGHTQWLSLPRCLGAVCNTSGIWPPSGRFRDFSDLGIWCGSIAQLSITGLKHKEMGVKHVSNVDKPSSPFKCLSANQLADQFDVSLRTVRAWDVGGILPKPLRISGAVRWRESEILAWADAGCPTREQWSVMRTARKLQTVF